MSAVRKASLTPEDYLRQERLASFKSEFINGEVFAMAKARRNHNLISLNIEASAKVALSNKSCEVYPSDMRVSPTGKHYYYPDESIACGKIKFLDDTQDTLLNPVVIIEVLSESTAKYDKGGKFTEYRKMASLCDYITVSQDEVLVERHTKQTDGSWLLREWRQLTDVV